jgi:hypothetical protein
MTVMGVGSYGPRPASLMAIIRLANSAKVWRLRTCGRLSVENTLLERLAQDLEHMTAKLGQFIQEEDAVVGRRHVTRHRHVAPTDQPQIRNGVMGGATRARRDQRRAVAGAADDAVDTCGLKGFRQRHRRQEGGEPPGQPRLPRLRGAEQQNVMDTTPASPLPSRPRLGVGADHEAGAGAALAAVPTGS